MGVVDPCVFCRGICILGAVKVLGLGMLISVCRVLQGWIK